MDWKILSKNTINDKRFYNIVFRLRRIFENKKEKSHFQPSLLWTFSFFVGFFSIFSIKLEIEQKLSDLKVPLKLHRPSSLRCSFRRVRLSGRASRSGSLRCWIASPRRGKLWRRPWPRKGLCPSVSCPLSHTLGLGNEFQKNLMSRNKYVCFRL